MKIYLTIILSYVLSVMPFSALPAFAAFNDVELTTSAIIKISGVNLTVSGGSAFAQQIDVDSESFTVVMPAGSYIKVSSADKRTVSVTELGSITRKFTCGSDESTMEVNNPAGGVSVTPTFSVSSGACAGGGGGGGASGGASGGGGGGGGGSAPSVPVQAGITGVLPAPVTPALSVASPSLIASAVSPVFNSNLYLGSKSDDVKRVQQLLNSDPDTKIASSGVGSPGNETNYFGPATKNALGKFQIKHEIVSSASDQGYGNLGPKTRAKLNEIFNKGVPSAAPVTPTAPSVAQPSPVAMAVSPVFNSDLQKGARNDDVVRLQELLAKDSSIYPDATVSGFYGSLTEQAVKKFQAKYGLPQVGRVGPATRAKLEEVFGGTTPAPAAPVPAPTPAPAVSTPPVPAPYVGPAPAVPVNPSIPFWLQLTPVTPGGASVVDPSTPTQPPPTPKEQLPDWMQMTPAN